MSLSYRQQVWNVLEENRFATLEEICDVVGCCKSTACAARQSWNYHAEKRTKLANRKKPRPKLQGADKMLALTEQDQRYAAKRIERITAVLRKAKRRQPRYDQPRESQQPGAIQEVSTSDLF
jgi:hypothetical protein